MKWNYSSCHLATLALQNQENLSFECVWGSNKSHSTHPLITHNSSLKSAPNPDVCSRWKTFSARTLVAWWSQHSNKWTLNILTGSKLHNHEPTLTIWRIKKMTPPVWWWRDLTEEKGKGCMQLEAFCYWKLMIINADRKRNGTFHWDDARSTYLLVSDFAFTVSFYQPLHLFTSYTLNAFGLRDWRSHC